MTEVPSNPSDDCTGECEITTGRRGFLKEGLMAVAALTAVAGYAPPLHALARSYYTGTRLGDTLSYPLPAADGATIDAANKVIVVRFQGSAHAFSLECPHRAEPVEWQPNNNRFFCPKHRSTFQPEGTLIGGRAERNMDRFPIKLEDGQLIVDRSTLIKNDDNAEAWAAAAVKLS